MKPRANASGTRRPLAGRWRSPPRITGSFRGSSSRRRTRVSTCFRRFRRFAACPRQQSGDQRSSGRRREPASYWRTSTSSPETSRTRAWTKYRLVRRQGRGDRRPSRPGSRRPVRESHVLSLQKARWPVPRQPLGWATPGGGRCQGGIARLHAAAFGFPIAQSKETTTDGSVLPHLVRARSASEADSTVLPPRPGRRGPRQRRSPLAQALRSRAIPATARVRPGTSQAQTGKTVTAAGIGLIHRRS